MVGHGGSSASSYLANPTSPIPCHCASTVATSTLRVKLVIWGHSTYCIIHVQLWFQCDTSVCTCKNSRTCRIGRPCSWVMLSHTCSFCVICMWIIVYMCSHTGCRYILSHAILPILWFFIQGCKKLSTPARRSRTAGLEITVRQLQSPALPTELSRGYKHHSSR